MQLADLGVQVLAERMLEVALATFKQQLGDTAAHALQNKATIVLRSLASL